MQRAAQVARADAAPARRNFPVSQLNALNIPGDPAPADQQLQTPALSLPALDRDW